jgi:hypothetical protein
MTKRFGRRVWPALVFAWAALGSTLPASAAAANEATYAALQAARPDGRAMSVHDLVLERDAYRFTFSDGAFYFLAPVGGRTFGAVFLGHGTFQLTPASEHERWQLALNLGKGKEFETLSDSFEELVLVFADDTFEEIESHSAIRTESPEPRSRAVYERWRERQTTDLRVNLDLRLLTDLLNTPGIHSGVFTARFEGKKLPPVMAAVDPNGAEALLGNRWGEEDTLLLAGGAQRGIWYLSDRLAEVKAKRASPVKRWSRALSYRVETTVRRDADVAGTTRIRFEVLSPGLRVLPIVLMDKLRISKAAYAVVESPPPTPAAKNAQPTAETPAPAVPSGGEPDWQDAAFVQSAAKTDGAAAVVFPVPLAKGATVALRIAYQGDSVLTDAGDKNFVVGARESWYANLGVFGEPAPFDLVYRVPLGSQIVSVGRQVASRTENGQEVSTWKTGPIRVAGFNYGKFKKLEKSDSTTGLNIQVFTNPGTPDIIRTINAYLSSGGGGEDDFGLSDIDGGLQNTAPQATLGHVDTGRLAEGALTDSINAGRVFTTYYGPLPDRQVAITQQSQFSFGQSWPSLIFLPYISFLDGTQRQRLGMVGAKEFVDQVGFHEFAHQWWGHLVTAASYRDQWLEEGFAEFSAALAIQHTQGWGAYSNFWRRAQVSILARPPGNAVTNDEAGPLIQGVRLYTDRSPSAYQAVIYEKGAFVLHMLRMLMWEAGAPSPDANFIALMTDFAQRFAGREVTNADFQHTIERHMVPALNATGDGRMDWFFHQWVEGTDVPRLVAELKLTQEGDQVRVEGTLSQQEVAADFRSLVPVYLEFDKSQYVRVALVPITGSTTVPVHLTFKAPPKRPRRVFINARNEILTR